MIAKYRAWDKETKTMIDVSLIDFKKGVLVGEHLKFGETNFMSFDEIVIMQSTGLKDKNGKEIFEGDIITNGIDIVDVRNHETLGFYTLVNGREMFFGHGTSIEEFEEDVEGFTEIAEIIGNIYENPELLEDKEVDN